VLGGEGGHVLVHDPHDAAAEEDERDDGDTLAACRDRAVPPDDGANDGEHRSRERRAGADESHAEGEWRHAKMRQRRCCSGESASG